MRKRKNGVPLIGGSSLLVIFAVLCLTVFAMLALSTVEAGGRLSSRSAAAVVAYYEADTKAEETLAALRGGELPEGVSQENGIHRFSLPISQGQTLQVALRFGETANFFEILQWQAVATGDWIANTDMPVWDGDASE